MDYNVKSGSEWLRVHKPKVDWRFLCWNTLNIPKCSFVFWEFLLQRLPTRDRLIRRGLSIDPTCPICLSIAENHYHLFYDCPFSVNCHQLLQAHLVVQFRLPDLVTWFSTARRVTKLQRRYIGSCYVALFYWIWRCRNEAWVDNIVRRPDVVVQQILADVKSKDRAWFQNL
ncbi:uncharacterized protein LOC141588218 [Silene latifolia]|uniref:uncharacterized protein LOC141588218 n=1 Tax=Silene latifolia TaxID=37657 RepID=UPI003D76D31D